jgi:hypothetical protein
MFPVQEGTVRFYDEVVGDTNISFPYTFQRRKKFDPSVRRWFTLPLYGEVTVPGYETTVIDFGL